MGFDKINIDFKHINRLLFCRDYRKRHFSIESLRRTPRFVDLTTDLFEIPFDIVDAASFLHMYKEIFEHEIYKFYADTESPVIIDCGANIGLSVLYFKKLFPESCLIAFEPDRKIFGILEKNVRRFNLKKVRLINKAVWSSETNLAFIPDGADGGRLVKSKSGQESINVPTVKLSDYMNKKINLLKIDVEGAETEVLIECQNKLYNVENLFVEYHFFGNQPQQVHTILKILAIAGFTVHFHTPIISMQPFYFRKEHNGMEMQVNIFAYRK